MNGMVVRMVVDRGFGFKAGDDGQEYFFHRNALHGVRFEDLAPGSLVVFQRGEDPGDEPASAPRPSAVPSSSSLATTMASLTSRRSSSCSGSRPPLVCASTPPPSAAAMAYPPRPPSRPPLELMVQSEERQPAVWNVTRMAVHLACPAGRAVYRPGRTSHWLPTGLPATLRSQRLAFLVLDLPQT